MQSGRGIDRQTDTNKSFTRTGNKEVQYWAGVKKITRIGNKKMYKPEQECSKRKVR